jgi:hypothetical protein
MYGTILKCIFTILVKKAEQLRHRIVDERILIVDSSHFSLLPSEYLITYMI